MIDLKDKYVKRAIGLKIQAIRLNRGLTLEKFGKMFQTSKATVNNWEKGRNIPNKENLKSIAELENLTVEEFLGISSDEELRVVQYIQDLTSPEDLEIKFSVQEYLEETGSDNVDELMKELHQLLQYHTTCIIPDFNIRMHGINTISELLVSGDDVIIRFSKSTLFFRSNPNWLRDSKRNVVVQ